MNGDCNMNNEELSQMKTNIAVILERTKILPDMDRRMREMDKKQSAICEKVHHNEKDITDLQKKSDSWDLINSIGAFFAAIGAILAGIFNGK